MASKPLRLRGRTLISAALGLLLFAEILLFGANRNDLAIAFSALWLLATTLILTRGWARRAVGEARLTWMELAFAATLIAGGLTLSAWAPGGAHPIWSWVPSASPTASIDPYLTIVELLKLAALAAVFLIGVALGADDERAKSALRWLLIFGLAYSLWAFIDHVTEPTLLFGAARSFDPTRLSASLMSANTAATLFGALCVLNLVALDRVLRNHISGGRLDVRVLNHSALKVALPVIGLIAAATCLVLTLSRSGIAATAAVAVILIGGATIMRARQGAVSAPIIAVGGILAGVVLASFAVNMGALQSRTDVLKDAMQTRHAIFAAHWVAFSQARLAGYGLGTFRHVNAMIMNRSNLPALDTIGAAHNIYLQWLEQSGIMGAIPMFVCVAIVTAYVVRGALRRRRMRSWLVAILAVLALFLIHGVTDFALEVPAMAALLTLLLGLGCGLAGPSRPKAVAAA